MKRLISLLLALSMALGASACGSVYSDYREIEQLLVIETMGVDYTEDGVTLSLASAADSERGGAVSLACRGESIASAFDSAQNYSFENSLFFAHIDSALIGEASARRGVDECMDYICQSPTLRMNLPVFIVRGGSAEDAVTSCGDASNGISELISSARAYFESASPNSVSSVSDAERTTLRYGSALVCALKLSPAIEEDGRYTAAAAGFAVLKDMKLCAYLNKEQALGAYFLMNSVGRNEIVVTDENGSEVTLEINHGGAEIKPFWDSDGTLTRVDVEANAEATVLEIDGRGSLSDAGYADSLTAQLESEISERISYVLRVARQLDADFVGLAGAVSRSDGAKYAAMDEDFLSLLPALELRVTVKGRLSHSNDTRRTD